MSLHDRYTPFRPQLTAEEMVRLETARLMPRPELEGPQEVSPETTIHMEIAVRNAEQQFAGWPDLPEDESITERYPAIDPMGKLSPIDMHIAQRMAQIQAGLTTAAPETQEIVNDLLKSVHEDKLFFDMNRVIEGVHQVSAKHRTLTRAAKLCHDPIGSELLQIESRALEESYPVRQMDMYLQGLEYLTGVRSGPVPQELNFFFADFVRFDQLKNQVATCRKLNELSPSSGPIAVDFQNLENSFLQATFSNPRRWGDPVPELEQAVQNIPMQNITEATLRYSEMTANRVLDPVFKPLEEQDYTMTFTRGDYIIVGGKTIRERMHEDFVAAKLEGHFDTYYKKNVQKMAANYVANALLTGKRVEMFVPNRRGIIPDEPRQLFNTGYAPKNPVILNGWQKFWSKFGFYKEKVKAADEYQQTLAARQRVKSRNLQAKFEQASPNHPFIKDQFLGKPNITLPDKAAGGYNLTRSTLISVSICAMLNQGHSMEDIFNPDKLKEEKLAMGRDVLARMTRKDHRGVEVGSQEWMGKTMFDGHLKLREYIDNQAKTFNFSDEKQLFQDRNLPLFLAASAAFDICQEKDKCKAEYLGGAERYAAEHDLAPAMQNGQPVMFNGHPVYIPTLNPEQLATEPELHLTAVGFAFNRAVDSLKARNELASGIAPEPHASLVNLLPLEASRKIYNEKVAAAPNAPFSSHFHMHDSLASTASFMFAMGESKNLTSFANALHDKNAQQNFGMAVISGQAQKSMQLTVNPDHRACQFKIVDANKLLQTPAPQVNVPQAGRVL